jgi:hypothetical protein
MNKFLLVVFLFFSHLSYGQSFLKQNYSPLKTEQFEKGEYLVMLDSDGNLSAPCMSNTLE